jgi:hypothetical protein
LQSGEIVSTYGQNESGVRILRPPTTQRESNAALADESLLDDAARRIARSGQALYRYYSQLDSLREAAQAVGNAVLAERASRAELHTRLMLSGALDTLNEVQDFGILPQSLRRAVAKPSTVNGTTFEEVLDHCTEMLSRRYGKEQWKWLAELKPLFSDLTVRFEPDGPLLRATVVQGGQQMTVAFTPEGGQRIDAAAFFGGGTGGNRATGEAGAIVKLSFPFSTADGAARSAYDFAVEGLASARESAYRHARSAVELGAPARSGAILPFVLALIIIGALVLTAGAINAIICKTKHDETACKWADILLSLGFALLASTGKKDDTDPNTGTARTRLQFGTNR